MNVVITGATKGIGRAIACSFAEGGHTIIACARTVRDLNEMETEFIARYPAATFRSHAVDVSLESEVNTFAQWLIDGNLVPDILVNNAGIFAPGTVENEANGMLENMMNINLYSAYNLTRLLLPSMKKKVAGHIFNICSIASLEALDNSGTYCITKFAMLGFSKCLREEMKPYGIKVTAIMPGATLSASWEGTGVNPQRIMEANDVAKMVFAASQLSPQAVVEDIVMRPQLGNL